MNQKIKDNYKVSLVMLAMSLIIVRMFVQNYSFAQPIVSKRAMTYTDVWNANSICQKDLDEAKQSIHDNNVANTADFNNR